MNPVLSPGSREGLEQVMPGQAGQTKKGEKFIPRKVREAWSQHGEGRNGGEGLVLLK